MTTLLIFTTLAEPEVDATRFGGAPHVSAGSWHDWPYCATCGEAMQFLGQLALQDEATLLLLFMCQNRPGLCNEWDANAGGNRVLRTARAALEPLPVPDTGDTLRAISYGCETAVVAEAVYEAARASWVKQHAADPSRVLGQFFGQPGWLQAAETPHCDHCRREMRFVAQLEEGPHLDDGEHTGIKMNFGGGGCAYVFDCDCDAGHAKLLWQR